MEKTEKPKENMKEKICGIIMPISSHTDYPREHWKDVLEIISEAISETEFNPKLVSDDPAIGLIHERIVQNIYNNDIIICDVSSKNPNVMFELGLRLAFDKPTIIIKDEKTSYSFDTGVVEHIEYPSSLRFNQIIKFKEKLKERLLATYEKSQKDKNYSPFLKSFGKTIVPATINHQEIPENKFILNQLNTLTEEIRTLRLERKSLRFYNPNIDNDFTEIPSYTVINKIIDEYNLKSKNPTKKGLIDFVLKRLGDMNYKVNPSELIDLFKESDEWWKKI